MAQLEKIEQDIASLSASGVAKLAEFHADLWDRLIESDAKSGRLDRRWPIIGQESPDHCQVFCKWIFSFLSYSNEELLDFQNEVNHLSMSTIS